MSSQDTSGIAILLRISSELDIIGDVSATAANPPELLAWANALTDATIAAWRGHDPGHRYLQVTADHRRAPVHGRITAVLTCDQHREFWHALGLDELEPGQTRGLTAADLAAAWSAAPLTPPDLDVAGTEPLPRSPLPD